MEISAYEAESKIEETHWWFVVRRKMFAKYLENLAKDIAILDVGSSSGTNLRMLKELGFTNYHGFDFSELSQKFCHEKNLGKVIIGDICNSKLPNDFYDIILATDVIEHIKDDELALKEINRILKPKGQVIITVPCFMSLWSSHDKTSMHQRRYRIEEIKSKIKNSELKVLESYYFNFFLFLPIFIFRKILKFFKIKVKSENSINNRFINQILKIIFIIDVWLAKRVSIPFGVSAFIRAEKKNNAA